MTVYDSFSTVHNCFHISTKSVLYLGRFSLEPSATHPVFYIIYSILLHTKSHTPQNGIMKTALLRYFCILLESFRILLFLRSKKQRKYVSLVSGPMLCTQKRGAKPLSNIMSHSMPQSAKTTEAARVAASFVSIKSSAQAHSRAVRIIDACGSFRRGFHRLMIHETR